MRCQMAESPFPLERGPLEQEKLTETPWRVNVCNPVVVVPFEVGSTPCDRLRKGHPRGGSYETHPRIERNHSQTGQLP